MGGPNVRTMAEGMIKLAGFPVVCETRVRGTANWGFGRRVHRRDASLKYFSSLRSTSRYRYGGDPITVTANDTVNDISKLTELLGGSVASTVIIWGLDPYYHHYYYRARRPIRQPPYLDRLAQNSCVPTDVYRYTTVHVVSKLGDTQEYITWYSTKAMSNLVFYKLLHDSGPLLFSIKNLSANNEVFPASGMVHNWSCGVIKSCLITLVLRPPGHSTDKPTSNSCF